MRGRASERGVFAAPIVAEADRRLEAERLMSRIRVGAAVLYVVVGATRPGDSVALTLALGAVLAIAAVAGIAVTRDRPAHLGRLSVLFAGLDTVIFLGILANNLDDPTDAVYIAGLLPVLEGALRWAKPGGIALGGVVGAATALWTAVLSLRAGEAVMAEDLTVRAGAMVVMGWAVGSIVRSLQGQQLALQYALEASQDALVTLDSDARIVWANDRCGPIFGCDPADLAGQPGRELLAFGGEGAPGNEVLQVAGKTFLPDIAIERPDGEVRWLEVHLTGVPRLGLAYAVCRDVTARREAELRLSHDAHHDPLTDLPNRRHLVEVLETALLAPGPSPALLFVDLDGFKAVNDGFGHDAGDDLLREAGGRMLATVRGGDVVARFAGDEFCILLRDADAPTIRAVADRLVSSLGEPFDVGGQLVRIGASVGATTHRDGEPAEELLRRADRTMYRAKHDGGDRAHLDLAASVA